MRYLIVGNGGREHTLAWKLKKEGHEIFGWPGNPGIGQIGENIDADVNIISETRMRNIDVAIIGPEAQLVDGLGERLEKEAQIHVVGCSQAASILEASKIFSKKLMHQNGIPTAMGWPCYNLESAMAIVDNTNWKTHPLVIKADKLCGGKGVLLPDSAEEAKENLIELMVNGAHGGAGRNLILEARLSGPEVSIMALVDAKGDYVLFPSSGDHKRRFEGDAGLNTGGMGAYAPSPYVNDSLLGVIEDTIIEPTIAAMAKNGTPFKGILYFGLMLTKEGPKVMEYNIRFGDPETQPQMVLVENLGEVIHAYMRDELKLVQLKTKPGYACCTVVATKGYPGDMTGQKSHVITGIEDAETAGAIVFHAGTANKVITKGYETKGVEDTKDGIIIRAGPRYKGKKLVNSGGRVLGVTYHSETLEEAARKSSECAGMIKFGDTDFAASRRDIGRTAVEYIAAQARK